MMLDLIIKWVRVDKEEKRFKDRVMGFFNIKSWVDDEELVIEWRIVIIKGKGKLRDDSFLEIKG